MATISYTQQDVALDGSMTLFTWTPVTNADTCQAVRLAEFNERAIAVSGTFNSASVALQGSDDDTNYAAMGDVGGTTIAITSAGRKTSRDLSVFVKPVCSSGGASQSLTITVLARRATTPRP